MDFLARMSLKNDFCIVGNPYEWFSLSSPWLSSLFKARWKLHAKRARWNLFIFNSGQGSLRSVLSKKVPKVAIEMNLKSSEKQTCPRTGPDNEGCSS